MEDPFSHPCLYIPISLVAESAILTPIWWNDRIRHSASEDGSGGGELFLVHAYKKEYSGIKDARDTSFYIIVTNIASNQLMHVS